MKRCLIALCLLLTPLRLPAGTFFGPGYITLFGGQLTQQEIHSFIEVVDNLSPDPFNHFPFGDMTYNHDILGGVAFGQVLDKMMRFEAEFSIRAPELDFWQPLVYLTPDYPGSIQGIHEPKLYTYVMNAYLDVSGLVPMFTPFVGAGLGGAYLHIRVPGLDHLDLATIEGKIQDVLDFLADPVSEFTTSPIVPTPSLQIPEIAERLQRTHHFSDNQVVWQVMAGFRIMEDSRFTASIYYRYFSTLSPFKLKLIEPDDYNDTPDETLVNSVGPITLFAHLHGHSVEFNWGWFVY